MPKATETEKMYEVRLSNSFVHPTVKKKPAVDKNGNKLPVMVLVAFVDTPQKKEFPFYGDETHLLTQEEYESACLLKVPASVAERESEKNPKSVNSEGRVINPNLVIKEVS